MGEVGQVVLCRFLASLSLSTPDRGKLERQLAKKIKGNIYMAKNKDKGNNFYQIL